MPTTEATLQDRIRDSIELYRQAKFKEAEAGFIASVELGRTLADSPIELIEALSGLCVAYFALSKFAQALEAIQEALSLLSTSSDPSQHVLRACLLNNQARVYAELEQLQDAEDNLLEAITLVEPSHPVYAAEFHANLLRFVSVMPRWHHKVKQHVEEFVRLQSFGENLQVYFDDMAGWRRPGKFWDIEGPPSPESLQARIIASQVMLLPDKDDAKQEYENNLRLEENSRQVSPHIVSNAYLSLAEIAARAGDYQSASNYCDDCLRFISSSYLGAHPSTGGTFLKLANVSLVGGNSDQAKKIIESTKALIRESLTDDNPHYARCISTEALLLPILADKGKDTTAEQLSALRYSCDILRRFFSTSHSAVIDMNLFTVKALIAANHLDEAERLLNETSLVAHENQLDALARQRSCLGILADLRARQGKSAEVEAALKMSESLLEQHEGWPVVEKLRDLDHIGRQYMDAGLFAEGERVYRQCAELTASMPAKFRQNAQQHLALCLMRIGKTADAGDVLGNIGGASSAGAAEVSRRDQLVGQSQLAWSLQAKRKFAQAKVLATEVVNESHLLMPEHEQSLVIALSVLMEQAKSENQPDEMVRLIGMLSGNGSSIRLRATMPMLYLEAAQLYAKVRSIKAESLFEKAVKAAEDVQSIAPQCLDGCLIAYMNYFAANRKNESALQLCDRLISLRTATSGTGTLEYAVAITAKARLLADTDPNRANTLSLEAFAILDAMSDPTTKVQLLITVSVREGILKKLLRFDEAAKMTARSVELRAELDSQMAVLKASRNLQK